MNHKKTGRKGTQQSANVAASRPPLRLARIRQYGAALLAAAAIATGAFMAGRVTAPDGDEPQSAVREGKAYKFINPLLECEEFKPSRLTSVVELKSSLRRYVDGAVAAQQAGQVSVYFRDLNAGPWVGINERDKFTPASLLKVPIMITVLKDAEKDRSLLDRQLTFQRNPNPPMIPNFVEGQPLEPGKSYSIDELILRMIAYSDNDARELILGNIDVRRFGEVLKDIGVVELREIGQENYISVKDYASFFRLLYNATYLNRDMSEKALGILSKATFRRGLTARLPGDVTVAHKFGERVFVETGTRQLHDCGIVYHKRSPYILCVMTRGGSFDQLATIIADISLLVFEEVSKPRWLGANSPG